MVVAGGGPNFSGGGGGGVIKTYPEGHIFIKTFFLGRTLYVGRFVEAK